ncbi:phosphoglycerol transferase MdoB-like AlkP superfamily enzyme [Clostridium tetanomorphum]|uniref:LTA synthase family protein n=1 Tax=Clostridium tetanomorphum TaxID=1553 RepID=A0A923E9V5_CLOTT|nr:LTA synthase family protein [Clostridium tetanomorphum]KAJ52781.1 Alkaline phosphatase superfamily protein [Clostridium tetanomorphum DSM 665]MBC2396468.1 LTA synthase family protein [Clostridium tetanomorphum]MBP1865364.1 phosphoglycerol transferase MdoB-like AlkP superfamily enzyme [Clostridium tetanomorphum]NRS84869.1 phosphoglycerol transferase MdoB-like AlkP superfamily enzyme [Clostridium tetanomorphum]NRZ98086.1 phosphoglycerol transferase MdoB-like AlkP superfamily enzyme [Clostridi
MLYVKKYVTKICGYLYDFLDIILFLLILIPKSLYFQKVISPTYFNYKSILNPILFSLLMIISIGFLIKRNLRAIYLYLMDILISLLYIGDIIYFLTIGDLVSFISIKNGFFVETISNNLLNYGLTKHNLLLLIDIIVLFPFLIKYYKSQYKQLNLLKRIFLFIICLFLSVQPTKSYIRDLNIEQPGLLKNMSNKIYVGRILNGINFHLIDGYNYFIRNKKDTLAKNYSESEIKDFINNKNIDNSVNSFTDKGNEKNLIVVQFESLQNFVINKKIEGKDITPNLNKFINKSLYYNNCFYQVMEGNTSDSEFIVNNSLYPLSSGTPYYRYANNNFNSLPKLLGNKGYYTSVFHGNTEGFWNRAVMYKSIQFKKFFGLHSFNIDEEIGMGLSDKSFFNQSFEEIIKFKEPFYSFLITLSSHYPFKNPHNTFNKGDLKDTFLGDYLSSIHYADEQLGEFLEKLSDSGLMDRSIVVIYGDHNGVPYNYINEAYKLDNIKNPNEFTYFMYQKVPLLIHFPKDEYKGTNNNYVGQMDIYPTIANLFNLKNPYMFGKDILGSSSNKVLFSTGSFIDKNILYISSSDSFYNIATGEKMNSSSLLEDMKNNYKKEIDYSINILKKDLIK